MPDDDPHVRTADVRPRGRSAVVLARRDTKPALHDLIDNLLDAARRNDINHPRVDISWSKDGDAIRIEDNCGGMENPEQVARLGESGATENDEKVLSDRLGWAGIGGITAALSLGESVTYRTRPTGADQGEEIRLSRNQFAHDELDEVPVYPAELEEGSSELIIEDVTAQEFKPREDGEVSDNENKESPDSFGKEIREDIASNYELFLGGQFPGDTERTEYHPEIEATVKVQGKSVTEEMIEHYPDWPEVEKDWSWLPMDDLYPRFLSRFRIRPKDIAEYTDTSDGELDIDGEIWMFLVCGLLRRKDRDQNGFTVYANYRKIYDSTTDIFGKFGFLKFGARRGRFACYIGLRTTGNPEDLPTTGQKDALQLSSPISEFIFSKANALGKEYLHWDDDGDLPRSVTMPYAKEHPASPVNEFGPIDYYGDEDDPKEYIRHKPGISSSSGRYRDYPELEEFLNITEFHGKLGIESPKVLPEKNQWPAYLGVSDKEASEFGITSVDGHLRDWFERKFDELDAPIPIDEAPSRDEIHEDEISEWRELGQKHGRESLFAVGGLPDFARPNYYEGLLKTGGVELPDNFRQASPQEICEYLGFEAIDSEQVQRHLQELRSGESDPGEEETISEQSTTYFIPETASREEQRVVARFLGIDIDEFAEMDRDEAWEILVERAERAASAGITFG